ncbi:unnamed protein product [Clonostachys chloroleuca]|uniref:Benzoate 4-monooxygenase cytochrome P450 n=1 Tax=Clonostachys chloroleuca TaxID=1926264 RepID=A0AA35M9G6_9HYPO|nr:unnamed protein product [Clonostachys chloroleuca]
MQSFSIALSRRVYRIKDGIDSLRKHGSNRKAGLGVWVLSEEAPSYKEALSSHEGSIDLLCFLQVKSYNINRPINMVISIFLGAVLGAALFTYFVFYPVAWYFWDPLELRRFPAPNFVASVSPLWLMKINASEKRSYRLHEAHKKLGPIVRVGPQTVYFNDPRAINDIYGHKAISKIIKDSFYDRLASKYHDIVQVRDREEHSRKRKYLAHTFALKTVVDMEPVIRDNAEGLIRAIDAFIDEMDTKPLAENRHPSVFNIRKWFNYFTLDVIGDMAFGLPMGFLSAASDTATAIDSSGKSYTIQSTIQALHKGIRYSITIGQITSTGLHKFLGSAIRCSPLLHSRLGAKAGDDFENISKRQLRERLAKGPPKRRFGDFMGKILEDKEGRPRSLPFGEVLAESVVVLAAGSDTTAAALTNTTYFLLSNPSCLQKLRQELASTVPKGHNGLVEYEHVRALPYLRACIDESLRLRPPITYPLPRLVIDPQGATVAGHFLKRGTIVAVPPYTIHRNVTLYKDPDEYNPDRWFEPDQSANLKAYNIPFSTGSRACIGRHIAIVELQILISTLVLRYDMWIDKDEKLDVFERFNANPGPLMICARRRIPGAGNS